MPLTRQTFWLLAALVVALIALPLYLVDIVPLLDYPAHLTRVTLLSHLPLDPLIARVYSVDMRPLANLAMDLFVPFVAPWVGPALGLKLFITLGLGLWMAGAALLYRGLWREWSLQPLASAFFALNPSFFDGYFNFHVAAGLALVGGGLWLLCRHSVVFLAGMAVLAVVLLFSHLMAVAILGLLLGALELGRLIETGFSARRLGVAAAKLGVIVLPAAMLWLFVLERGAGGAISHNWLANALALGVYSSQFAGLRFDAAPIVALAVAYAIAWRLGRLRLAGRALPAVGIFLLATLLMPSEALGGAGIHVRLPAVVAVLMLVATRIDLAASRRGLAAALLVAVLALGTAIQAASWVHDAAVLDRTRQAIRAHVPDGARMSAALVSERDGRFWHAVDLAILDRKTSVPAFFTTPGQSTMRLNPAYADIAAHNAVDGGFLPFAVAVKLLQDTPPVRGDAVLAPRFRPYHTMVCDFDFLLLMGAPPADFPQPTALVAMTADPAFTLYRIVPSSQRGCAPR